MLTSLPPELISAIAAIGLSARDVLSLAQTCRDARNAVWAGRADYVWRALAVARWGVLAAEPPAAEAAQAVGGWRDYYLRRSSLRLARGRGTQPRRPASARRALFWGEDKEEEEEAQGDDAAAANDDAAVAAPDQNQHQQPPPSFLSLGPNGADRSPLDLVQEAYQPEPWHVIVACMLIARTSGGATPLATIARFLEQLPTPTDVVRADDAVVESLLQPLGLQRNRRASVKAAGRAFLCAAWADPSELRGCGKFVSDSWRVFCRGEVGGVRGIDDAMLRQFVRWCGGGGGGGGWGGGAALRSGGARRWRRSSSSSGSGGGRDGPGAARTTAGRPRWRRWRRPRQEAAGASRARGWRRPRPRTRPRGAGARGRRGAGSGAAGDCSISPFAGVKKSSSSSGSSSRRLLGGGGV